MEMLIDDRPAVVLRLDALRTAKARRAGRQDPSGHGTVQRRARNITSTGDTMSDEAEHQDDDEH